MRYLLLILMLVVSLTPVVALQPGGGGIYSNVTCFYINTTSGALSNYPILLNLTNASGTNGAGIIYTGGLTLANWKDVNWTDSTGNTRLFNWRENNTATSVSSYWWVNPQTIASDNTTSVCVYFGNATASSENSGFSGYSTFSLFDDFIGSSLNTTQWFNGTAGTYTQSGGFESVTASAITGVYVQSNSLFGVNYSMRTRFNVSTDSNYFDVGFVNNTDLTRRQTQTYQSAQAMIAGDGSGYAITSLAATPTTMGISDVTRNATFLDGRWNGGALTHNSTRVISNNLPIIVYSEPSSGTKTIFVDWIALHPFVFREPTTSLYTLTLPAAVSPVASFTADVTSGVAPLTVQFNDTSTNTPTAWNWNFTNVTGNNTPVSFSTSQNPSQSFGIGNFSIKLNASNSAGSNISAQTTFVNVSSTPELPISANFTSTPNPSNTGQSVQFNDTSTGTPVTWNWTFGDIGGSNTSTVRNATHTYTAPGNYTVLFNVTNTTGAWSNTSKYQLVTNATGFTPQDVWMEGQYLQTFHITDSTTGMPISVTTLTLSPGGSTFTTTNGTGYLTTGFGIYTVTFVSTGYNGKTISYAFDSDQTHAVQLTPANPGGSQNVWYTPWQVRIRIVDYYGKPLPDTNVTAFYIASTLPNTNTTWLTSAYGISPEVASDMVNSAVAMAGRTDDNGGLSFTMFKSLEYHLEITNTTSGVSATKNLYPSDPEYVIYVQTAGQGVGNNTLGLRNATLPWYSLNSSYISLNMSYIDGTHCTGNVTFRVWFRNNGSELHNATQSAATGTQITDSHIVLKAPIGTEYLWGYNATTNC